MFFVKAPPNRQHKRYNTTAFRTANAADFGRRTLTTYMTILICPDHIFEHFHARTVRMQEHTKVRKRVFHGQESAKKHKSARKKL